MKNVFIHPTALVETEDIGEGTRIWAFSHIMKGAKIGKNCNICDNVFIEGGAIIGDNSTVKNGVLIWEGVNIGNGVFVGPNAIFTNDKIPRSPRLEQAKHFYASKEWLSPTIVEEGVSIGAGAIILPSLILGKYSFIGAGAVVTKSVHPYTVVYGNPALLKGYSCECGGLLFFNEDMKAKCKRCSRNYKKINSTIILKEEKNL